MNGRCFHSSYVPSHWSKSPEIFGLLNTVHLGNYEIDTWFSELLTYMLILIHESTTGANRTPVDINYPIFVKSKIICIIEKIYESMKISLMNDTEITDETWDDYEDMLLFELTKPIN